MKQFYETYKEKEFVSTLLTQINWSNHLAILSSSKSDEVVEFALSRSLSPTLISDYTLKLIDKKLLRQKLHEITEMADFKQIENEEQLFYS